MDAVSSLVEAVLMEERGVLFSTTLDVVLSLEISFKSSLVAGRGRGDVAAVLTLSVAPLAAAVSAIELKFCVLCPSSTMTSKNLEKNRTSVFVTFFCYLYKLNYPSTAVVS